MTAIRAAAALLTAGLCIAACGSAPATTPAPSVPAATTPVATAAPSPTEAPDVAALMAEAWGKVSSSELRLEGTLLLGDVQATFTGVSKTNGPDSSSTLSTTVGGQVGTQQKIQVAGRRFVQNGSGPWLADTASGGGSKFGDALQTAMRAAVDLDADATGTANHRIEAKDQPFDPVSAGFASVGSKGKATFTFTAKPDGTPVSVKIAAAWTQPGENGDVDSGLDLTVTFIGLNTKPTISAPEHVWQSFVSDRWGYSVAYPDDHDYEKDDSADYFIPPHYGVISIGSGKTAGFTLNQIASSEVAETKSTLKSKNITNEAISVGGEKARLLTATGTSDGVKVVVFEAVVVHGKDAYVIVWFGEDGDNQAQLTTFAQLLSTFKFTAS